MVTYRDIILKYKVETDKQLTDKDLKDIIDYFNIDYKIKFLKNNYCSDECIIDYIIRINHYYEDGFDLLSDLNMLQNVEAFKATGSKVELLTEKDLNEIVLESFELANPNNISIDNEKLLINDFKELCKHWYHKEADKFIADYEADIMDNMIEDRVDVVGDIYNF